MPNQALLVSGLAQALPQDIAPTTAAGRGFHILQQLLAAGKNLSPQEQVRLRKELQD